MPLSAALKYGNAAAAIVVSRLMCSEAMPVLSEIEALIAQTPRQGTGDEPQF